MNNNLNRLTTFRFQVFSEFASSLVHEIRNPLSAINLGLELIDMGLPEGDNRKPTLQSVYRSSERVNQLLENLSLYCQNGASAVIPCRISQIIAQAGSLVNYYLARKHVGLEKKISEPEPLILANSGHLLQAIVFLLINSAKRMDKGGGIVVEVGVSGESVALRYSDTGNPYDLEFKRRLDQPENGEMADEQLVALLAVKGLVEENRGAFSFNAGEPEKPVVEMRFPSATPKAAKE